MVLNTISVNLCEGGRLPFALINERPQAMISFIPALVLRPFLDLHQHALQPTETKNKKTKT